MIVKESSGGKAPSSPSSSSSSSLAARRPSKLFVILLTFSSALLFYWTWSSSSSSSKNVDFSPRNRRCLNDDYLLTRKIKDCENGRGLASVKPRQFGPRQASLTFFGVKGELGVSWVTYDGEKRDHYILFCRSADKSCSKLDVVETFSSSAQNPPPPFHRADSSCHLFLPFFDCRYLILHSANLTGLQPGRRYRYRIFSDDTRANRRIDVDELRTTTSTSSDAFEFLYPANYHVDESSSSPQRFLIFSDMSVDDRGGIIDSLVKEVEEHPPVDMMLAMGDYAYDLMTPRGGLQLADYFKEQMEPIAARIPFMTCPGNHERFPDPGGSFYQYLWRFRMPGNWPDETKKNLSYSINVGKAHLVFLNSEALYGPYATDLDSHVRWLEADLKAAVANRVVHPWILVLGHVPTFCPPVDPPTSRWFCRGLKSQLLQPVGMAIERLLYEYRVDVAFWGDFHQYQRTFPMYRDRRIYSDVANNDDGGDNNNDNGPNNKHMFRDPRAPIHVVNAVAGNQEGVDILQLEGGANTDPKFRLAPWSAFRSRDLGFGRLTLHNSTHLHYSQISVLSCPMIDASSYDDPCGSQLARFEKTATKHRRVIDQFWIVKKDSS